MNTKGETDITSITIESCTKLTNQVPIKNNTLHTAHIYI